MTDVLMLSDFRLPGGTSHSNAEEVECQHRLGLSTGLVQLNGGLSAYARGLNQRLAAPLRDRWAHLEKTPDEHRGTLAVVRHPATLQWAWEQLGPVHVDEVVVVVNATPVDWLGKEHYQPEVVHELVEKTFGIEPTWAPIGPRAREAIVDRVPRGHLRARDWVNVVDVDHWWVDRRSRDRSGRPVVGRHSRPSPQKWPQREERELVYPSDGRWDFRALGWSPEVRLSMGGVPRHWTVLDFGAMSPRDFLAELDFFVYFHHPDLVEAFGRTILEAIAAGLPAILPPHFEALFGQAALYAEPEQVRDLVESLWADREAYDTHVALAGALVRHRFGYEAHAARLREHLGYERVPLTLAPPAPVVGRAGTGVLVIDVSEDADTRSALAVALADARVQAALTVDRVRLPGAGLGAAWSDVVPTAADLSVSAKRWAKVLAGRVQGLVDAFRPSAIVWAGADAPSNGVLSSAQGLGALVWWLDLSRPETEPAPDQESEQPDIPSGVVRVHTSAKLRAELTAVTSQTHAQGSR